MKICVTCKQEKETSLFNNNKSKPDGKHSECKNCSTKRAKDWRLNNKTKIKDYDTEWREANRDKKAKHYKKWQQLNKETVRGLNAKRRAYEQSAIPLWFDKEKVQYYYNIAAYFTELSGGFVKYHVDHVIPLKGKNVCGLHVQNNLQVLKAVDNLRKSNKHECNF